MLPKAYYISAKIGLFISQVHKVKWIASGSVFPQNNKHHLYFSVFTESIKGVADASKLTIFIKDLIFDYFYTHSQPDIEDIKNCILLINQEFGHILYLNINFIYVSNQNKSKFRIIIIGDSNNYVLIKKDKKIFKTLINKNGIVGTLSSGDVVAISQDSIHKKIENILNKNSNDLDDYISDFNLKIENLDNFGLIISFPKEKFKTSFFFRLKNKFNYYDKKKYITKKYRKEKFNKPKIKILKTQSSPLKNRSKTFLNKKRFAVLMAIFFIIVLILAVYMGHKKRMIYNQNLTKQQLVEDITYRLDQAKSLRKLNPQRAKTLLDEANDILNLYLDDNPANLDINKLQIQLDEAYAEVSHKYTYHQLQNFYDLSLVKEGFNPDKLSLANMDLRMLDSNNQALINLDISKKSAEIIAGSEIISKNSIFSSIDDYIFLITNKKFIILNADSGKQEKSFKFNTINIDQLIGYGSNAYVLDKENSQVWRFRGTEGSLSKPDPFFNKNNQPNMEKTAFLAIDGSLWLVDRDGGLSKFTGGVKDAYYPKINVDPRLVSVDGFYLDEYTSFIYILDGNQHRIIVVDKNGRYQSQYIWEGLTPQTPFVVSEQIGKILLIDNGKILEIDLR